MVEKTVATKTGNNIQSGEQTRSENRYVAPPVDIYEQGEELVVVTDLPGTEKNSISVDVKEGILTIQGTPAVKTPGTLLYREFETSNYYRQFELAESVDIEKISADYNHGVLKLKLPKAERARTKKIEVKTA